MMVRFAAMRRAVVIAVAVAAAVVGAASTGPARAAGSPLRVQVDKSKVDLKQHRLEVKMSHPAGKVKITVHGESGAVLADEEQDFAGRAAGTPLVVTWSPSSDDAVAKIELRAYDAAGSWVGVELSPWFVPIPHEDVNFRTDSADIDAAETPKLEAAYTKLGEVLAKDKEHGRMHAALTLYIAGHTDTVGSDAHNIKLSQARARSIAAWFRQRGVRLPIAYEGFGETSPAVRTPDNTDEARNRRADYILSDDPPAFKTTGFRPSWKRMP
jgi:outer membrane protein OmpA-like peptidoglycan-associated protein